MPKFNQNYNFNSALYNFAIDILPIRQTETKSEGTYIASS